MAGRVGEDGRVDGTARGGDRSNNEKEPPSRKQTSFSCSEGRRHDQEQVLARNENKDVVSKGRERGEMGEQRVLLERL